MCSAKPAHGLLQLATTSSMSQVCAFGVINTDSRLYISTPRDLHAAGAESLCCVVLCHAVPCCVLLCAAVPADVDALPQQEAAAGPGACAAASLGGAPTRHPVSSGTAGGGSDGLRAALVVHS
jgi:hypothetical protein